MKQFKYIFATLVLLVPVLAHAASDDKPAIFANYKIENGVATSKKVTGAADGSNLYTLTLETFATGEKTYVKTYTPVEVILVLDTSQSMVGNNYTYYDEDRGQNVTTTRLNALKYAVKKFVDQIAKNDGYSDDEGTIRRVDEHGNETTLGNRIQIVTFDTRVDVQFDTFQDVFANAESIKTKVDGFGNRMGTRTDLGMQSGLSWVQTSVNERPNSNRVVVMFTDGCPTNGGGPTSFDGTCAQNAVNYAEDIKGLGATVYSIGMIDWDQLRRASRNYPDWVLNMMDYISSNYPDGHATWTNNTFTCTGTRVSVEYNFYVDANETDLGQIFVSIGQAHGGSTSSVPGETLLVDEVSSSFEIPRGTTVNDLTIYTRKINSEGTGWVTGQTMTKYSLPADYDLTALPPTEIANAIKPENVVGVYLQGGKLVIVGFNYSKLDSDDRDGSEEHPYDGNWVGWRPLGETGRTCAGVELVVEFNISAQDGVTGGDHTNTNTSNSGVYVPAYDKDGHFLGYENATYYPYPDTDLPINLVIKKTGLKHGESATIQIYRAPQLEGQYDENTGKPKPDLSNGWENFSKVILTNKGIDGEAVVKTLLSLDPKYVYRLKEDDWGWGYNLDTTEFNTSSTIANPFIFTNSVKENTPKHAEAVSINHFGSNAHAETYKSSKVESF